MTEIIWISAGEAMKRLKSKSIQVTRVGLWSVAKKGNWGRQHGSSLSNNGGMSREYRLDGLEAYIVLKTDKPPKGWLSPEDIAKLKGVNRLAVYGWIKEGLVEAKKCGPGIGFWFINPDKLPVKGSRRIS